MMKKLLLVPLGLVVVLVMAYALMTSGSEAAPASFSVEMTSGRKLNSIAYNIILKNPTASPVGDVFVSGLVPSGTRYVAGSATSGGTLQGDQVVWVLGQVPAKGQTVLTYKVTATAPAVGPNHAWVRALSPNEKVVVSTVVTANYQLAKIKGINIREEKEPYPAGKIALTTTSGKGHQENQISTSGLDNVGAGEYVYLEGAKHDNLENDITAWMWRLVGKPVGSQASMDSTDKQVMRFIPDRVGDYLVEVSTTNAKGQSASSVTTVNAGKYAGISLCASCHDGSVPGAKDIVSSFVKTGHSDKFEKFWDSYSKDSDYCIRCHTLGYNEQGDNGGMDDARPQLRVELQAGQRPGVAKDLWLDHRPGQSRPQHGPHH